MKITFTFLALVLLLSCQSKVETNTSAISAPPSKAKQIADLKANGYEIFNYYDDDIQDTVIMQKYFLAFLNTGPNRSQDEEEATKIQKGHRAHLGRMYELGYADISGPLEDSLGVTQGITIYNVPNLATADSLVRLDPAVQSGRLVVDIKPLWAGKGFALR
ncbi:YciI family protein [Dokdonia sp. 4H-3-7-5]|uniref:YciI family protein n=1 Tax=Dokdonia sp. (strain 4H-3-7-5) TaxID=983548 RepID=UPI00020A60DB|nr:YciI family protein [Dokdonia sp. 4H-3-7-5]AEE19401.1 YCII-related protein [Dokdonia sp. 4H-3-7-5]